MAADTLTTTTTTTYTDGSVDVNYDRTSIDTSSSGSSASSTSSPLDSVVTPDPMTSSSYTVITPESSFSDVLIGGLVAAFKSIFNLLVTKGILLGLLLVLVDFVISFFLQLIGSFLKMSDLSNMINQLPNKDLMGYFFYLGALDYGLPLVLSAYLLKFFIRRLPFVG